MCRGRHRVKNRLGEVQARGGAGWGGVGRGGVVTYFADRIGTMLQILLLSPGIRVGVNIHFEAWLNSLFTAVLS